MILDWNPTAQCFLLRVPRGHELTPEILMKEHGLDFSTTASTAGEAVFLTRDPYAAATFGSHATPRASEQFHTLLTAIADSWKLDSGSHFKMPADKELWGFQKADLDYGLQRTHWLDGDQPGLGKTPTAIVYCNEIDARKVLVVCPANIRKQWAQRISEWTTMPWNHHVHVVRSAKDGVYEEAEWIVLSYEMARTPAIWRVLSRMSFDALIIDEAHYLKTIGTRRTRAIFGGGEEEVGLATHLAERSRHVVALTGTPLPNRPKEAYVLSRGLNFDAIDWMSEDKFVTRYNPSVKIERDLPNGETIVFTDERSGRHAELQNRMRSHFMTRHLKRDVMPQLKMPVYDIVQCEETGPVKQALAAEKLLDIDPENLTGKDLSLFGGQIATIRKQMGIAIAPQAVEYVKMLLDGGEEKVVLFAWHHEVMDILAKGLERYGVRRIDGRVTGPRRDQAKDDFIQDPRVGVLIGQLQSVGVGTDGLQLVCGHGVIAEPSWTPSDNEQAFDRLDRGGQTRTVYGEILVAPGSFAEKILASALWKMQTTHKSLDRRF